MSVARFIRGASSSSAPAVDESLLQAVKLALRIDGDEADSMLARNIAAAMERANRQAPDAPQATTHEAIIRFVGWLYEGPAADGGISEAGAWRRCGAEGLLAPWTVRRAGAIVMRWPWQRRTESRASFTDVIVAALYAGAAGTGTRDALATAALEAVAALYAGAFARARARADGASRHACDPRADRPRPDPARREFAPGGRVRRGARASAGRLVGHSRRMGPRDLVGAA